MKKQIALIKPQVSQYDVQHYFMDGLHTALLEKGIGCFLMDVDNPEKFLDTLLKEQPYCTLSFNAEAPDPSGRLLFDVLRIPHVAILLDSVVNNYLYLTKSPYYHLACVDRTSVDFLHSIGFNRSFFLPHAIENTVVYHPDSPKAYDITMLGSCIDYKKIEESWDQYSKPLQKAMVEAAETTLSSPATPCYQALLSALNKHKSSPRFDVNNKEMITILDQVELYVRGKDRIELINAIRVAPIHIFGSGNWEKYFGQNDNVVVHPPVPFTKALELMQSSKIILNSSPQFKFGAHERIFYGLASGAAVLCNKNSYLSGQFKENVSILFYQYPQWENINTLIGTYLNNDDKRAALAKNGRKIAMKSHAWSNRVSCLIEYLQDHQLLGV